VRRAHARARERPGMSTEAGSDLERIFEAVSTGIDAAGPDQAQLFLGRLCLLLAQEIGDTGRVLDCVARAGTADRD
jgi:hypothetical protein